MTSPTSLFPVAQPSLAAAPHDQQATARPIRAIRRHGADAEASAQQSRPPERAAPVLSVSDLPAPVPPGSAKIKLELRSRSDDELSIFGESHALAMEGNPWFPTPVPSVPEFDATLAEYESLLTDLTNLRLQAKSLTEQKDRKRSQLEAALTQRGYYVQIVSNGNPTLISSAGLDTRSARTRTGPLLPPRGLRLEVTQSSGELRVHWDPVEGARSYLLHFAESILGEPPLWQRANIGGKSTYLCKQLTPGKRYIFTVAVIGGAEGISSWSPIVERMVA